MNQLITYVEPSIFSNLSNIITFIDPLYINGLYTFKLCCDKSKLFLPTDIWKLIIYNLCLYKAIPVDKKRILDWFDDYITNPLQQKLNPILVVKYGCTPPKYLIFGSQNKSSNVGYEICNITLNNNKCGLYRYGDIFLGIVKNESIKSIKINIQRVFPDGWTSHDQILTYNQTDLYEFKFQNVYSHSLDDIMNNKNKLFEEQYKIAYPQTYWTMRDIFPFNCINSYRTNITFTFETVSPLTQVEFLYAWVENNKKLKTDYLKYKGMLYFDGMFYKDPI